LAFQSWRHRIARTSASAARKRAGKRQVQQDSTHPWTHDPYPRDRLVAGKVCPKNGEVTPVALLRRNAPFWQLSSPAGPALSYNRALLHPSWRFHAKLCHCHHCRLHAADGRRVFKCRC
jgi:hypothetical protein